MAVATGLKTSGNAKVRGGEGTDTTNSRVRPPHCAVPAVLFKIFALNDRVYAELYYCAVVSTFFPNPYIESTCVCSGMHHMLRIIQRLDCVNLQERRTRKGG